MTPAGASYHKGTLPPAGTFFSFDAPDAMVSSVNCDAYAEKAAHAETAAILRRFCEFRKEQEP